MSDQVDTDALPPEADATPDEAFELGEVHGYDKGYADGFRAAADEVDRLRADRDSWQRRAGDLYDEWDQQVQLASALRNSRDTWKRLANDERDLTNRLRAIIADAPHMESCQMSYLSSYPKARCSCWKAEAL